MCCSIGEDKEEGQGGASTYQVKQDLQACLIAPVEVFDDEQDWLPPRLRREEVRDRREQAPLLLFRIRGWQSRCRSEFGHQQGQFGQDPRQCLRKRLQVRWDWCARRGSEELGTKQVKQSRIRSGVITLKAVSLEEEETLIGGRGFDLGNQA